MTKIMDVDQFYLISFSLRLDYFSDIKLLERDQAGRAENHYQYQKQGDDDPLKKLQRPQHFTQQTDTAGADDGTVHGVQSAEIDHCQNFGQFLDTEGSRIHVS